MAAPAPLPPAGADPEAALAHAWALLAHGLAERASPMRTPVLATVRPDGAPAARTVILRAVDAGGWRVGVFTDARSAKVAELEAEPCAALVFHEPAIAVQVRLAGRMALHRDDAAALAAWRAAAPASLDVYRSEPAPGTPIPSPAAAGPRQAHDPMAGYAHFVLLEMRVALLDWLHLDPAGHRRLAAARAADGGVRAGWVAP